MVKSLDDSVGNIVQSLVKTGMMDDTILVFYSDNGGPTTFKVIHPTTANNYPLRGVSKNKYFLISKNSSIKYLGKRICVGRWHQD